jgi:enterochelin esterase-like enzyme
VVSWGSRTVVVAGAIVIATVATGTLASAVTARGEAARIAPPAAVPAITAVAPAVDSHDCTPVATTPPPAPQSLPGHIERLSVGGHAVIVDVPGAYAVLPATRFPAVYFLHGSPGEAADWIGAGSSLPQILDTMIAGGQLMPMIAVFPDDQGVTADDSWWGNTALGDTVESWFVGRLVPTIDASYRTLGAAYRGIAGLSAGGFGAVNVSTHHPGMFSWVASYSGVFTAPQDLFGSAAAANSPQITVASLPVASRTPLFVGGGAEDSEFLPDTEAFIALVESLGWAPLQTDIVPGPHGWQAWQAEARDSLVWLGRLWGPGLLDIPVVAAVTIPRDGCPS